MRTDPERLRFEIEARDGAARTGRIHTAHGPVETPAFIPLATKRDGAGARVAEVAELGYELVLGNTYHLFVSPGAGADRRSRRAARVHGLGAGADHRLRRLPGLLARPRRRRRRDQGPPGGSGRAAACSRSPRRGALPLLRRRLASGSSRPEVSMEVQAALGSDIALVFDECTPYHADRDYTARSTERTHRWLDRCLEWHASERPAGARRCSGSSRAASTRTCGASRRRRSRAAGVDGIAIGGTLGRDKEEMRGVLAMTAPLLPAEAPKHLLGIGEVDDLLAGIALGLDVFDCAVPTRLARHGVALAPAAGDALPPRPAQGALGRRPRAAGRGLPLPGLRPPRPRLPPLPLRGRGADRRCACSSSTTSPTSSAW